MLSHTTEKNDGKNQSLPGDFSACSCSDQLVNQKLSLQHPQPLDNHFQLQGDTGCMV